MVSTSSGRDTTVAGAHVEGDRVFMDVGRNLTVASLQDTYDRDASNWSAGVDVTVGYGVMVGLNLGYGEGESDMDWVGDQTAIIGRKEVDIYVEDHTHLKGAIIATQADGDLTLNTGTLSFEEIQDKNKNSDWNASVSVSTTFGGGYGPDGKILGMDVYDFTSKPSDTPGADGKGGANGGAGQAGKPGGSNAPYIPDSTEFTYASNDMRGVLRPTVTDGTIIVRDDPNADLGGLNRDITKAREITKDEEIYVDVYVSPGAIEEVLSGFKGIRGQLAEINKSIFGETPVPQEGSGNQGTEVLPKIRTGVIATQPDKESTHVQEEKSCPGI